MTFKTDMSIDYARDIYARLRSKPQVLHLVVVDENHTPRVMQAKTLSAMVWMRREFHRCVGYYRGVVDVTPEDIAEAIDAVDDYVPKKYRNREIRA